MKLLDEAIERDAYNWFLGHQTGLDYLNAITQATADGRSPEEIRYYIAARVGPDRAGLALRAEQAARHILRG